MWAGELETCNRGTGFIRPTRLASAVMPLGSMKVTARQVDDKIELGERDEQILNLGSFALRSPTARVARVLNISGGDHEVPVRDDDCGPTCQCSRSNHGSSASGRVP